MRLGPVRPAPDSPKPPAAPKRTLEEDIRLHYRKVFMRDSVIAAMRSGALRYDDLNQIREKAGHIFDRIEEANQ